MTPTPRRAPDDLVVASDTHDLELTCAALGDGPRVQVTGDCSCWCWAAQLVVNPDAPAYDHQATEATLERLHADHQADVRALTALADLPAGGAA